MIDFKDKIAEEISKVLELTKEDLKDYIEIPKILKWEIMLFHVLNLQKK